MAFLKAFHEGCYILLARTNIAMKFSTCSLPRITIPVRLQKNIGLKLKKRREEKFAPNKGSLLLKCSQRTMNLYANESSAPNVSSLATRGWKNYRSEGRSIIILPQGKNPSLSHRDASFSDLGLSSQLCVKLSKQGLAFPSTVQDRAIPAFLTGDHFAIISETGSGKTLAYLLPIVDKLLQLERKQTKSSDTSFACPMCVVLVPTLELINQVKKMASRLINPECVVDITSLDRSDPKIFSDSKIFVGTPSACLLALRRNLLSFSSLDVIILDEGDTLLDDSFYSEIKLILQKTKLYKLKNHESGTPTDFSCYRKVEQLCVVCATVPSSLENLKQEFFHDLDIEVIKSGWEQRLLPHIRQTFLRVRPSRKEEALLEELRNHSSPTIIFCNKNSTSVWLAAILEKNGVVCSHLAGSLDSFDRAESLRRFEEGRISTIVATDIASRGLDILSLQRVINFDFPLHMSDYIHRIGRIGRLSPVQLTKAVPTVLSLISYKWDVDLLWAIESSLRASQQKSRTYKVTKSRGSDRKHRFTYSELPGVNANIKHKLKFLSQSSKVV